MGYKLVVPSTMTATATSEPSVSHYDLGQKIKAALAAGAFAAVGITVLMWVSLVVLTEIGVSVPWRVWLGTLVVALVIGVLVACWLGYEWVIQVACRAWTVDDRERAYRRELERGERERQEKAARSAREQVIEGDDVDGNPATLTDQQRLDLVALALLERHYIQGKASTREDMERDGCCTQAEWNLVNKALLGAGIKKGYTMLAPDFAMAWARWRESVKLEDGHLWVLTGRGKWQALEQVAVSG